MILLRKRLQQAARADSLLDARVLSAGTGFIIGLSYYSSPPTKSLGRRAEKAEPPCFSSLEVSGSLTCGEVGVNETLTLWVILSFMVCFNQYMAQNELLSSQRGFTASPLPVYNLIIKKLRQFIEREIKKKEIHKLDLCSIPVTQVLL